MGAFHRNIKHKWAGQLLNQVNLLHFPLCKKLAKSAPANFMAGEQTAASSFLGIKVLAFVQQRGEKAKQTSWSGHLKMKGKRLFGEKGLWTY